MLGKFRQPLFLGMADARLAQYIEGPMSRTYDGYDY